MLLQLDETIQAKLAVLRPLRGLQVGELVAVHWPLPTGTIYYAQAKYDELPEYQGLTLAPIEARFEARVFQSFQVSSNVADSSITPTFIDDDGEIARLCDLHGEGVRVELWHYLPQADLLVKRNWFGHLGTPTDVGGSMTTVPASFGFRSSQLSLPNRPLGAGCVWPFGGAITDPAILAENPCKYDRHLGGTHGLLDGSGQPYRTCPKNRVACGQRIGDTLEYGGGDTATDTIIVNQTQGPNRQATSKGNESNLSQALRVVAGEWTVREMDVLAWLAEPNTKHPDQGSAHVLAAASEGPIESLEQPTINDKLITPEHRNIRLGDYRQPATFFSRNVNNYSFTAHFNGVVQGDFRNANAATFRCSSRIRGYKDVRVYSAPDTYVKQFTMIPAYWILEMLTNKRWGDGRDHARYVIEDWIECAAWNSAQAGFEDASGAHYASTRATFSAEILERATQQQIKDACLFSFLSLPFPFQGNERIMPLRKEDLTNVPIFSDDLDLLARDPTVRPILFEGNQSSLRTPKAVPEGELTNYMLVKFFDKAHDYIQRPLIFQDEEAQWIAGAAHGDKSRRLIKAEYSLFGVKDFGQAVRCANRMLDLGEFDKGGRENNRQANFKASYIDTLDLHPCKVIKIVSKKIERYGFQYFRLQTLDEASDLTVQLNTVAYPEAYYEHLEDVEKAPVRVGTPIFTNPGGLRGRRPSPIDFTLVDHGSDRIIITLAEDNFIQE